MGRRRTAKLGLGIGLAAAAIGLAREMPSGSADVARGKYLVSAMGCGSCHTPKVQGPTGPKADASRLLSGHPESSALGPAPELARGPWVTLGSWDSTAFAGPWGVSYSSNLTPDENTGLGSWSEEMFVRALRTGRHMGASRPILPPMPWGAFRNLTDGDLRSIGAWCQQAPRRERANRARRYQPAAGTAQKSPLRR